MFRRFLRHKIIRDKDLLLTFPKPPLFPRLLPRTSVGNVCHCIEYHERQDWNLGDSSLISTIPELAGSGSLAAEPEATPQMLWLRPWGFPTVSPSHPSVSPHHGIRRITVEFGEKSQFRHSSRISTDKGGMSKVFWACKVSKNDIYGTVIYRREPTAIFSARPSLPRAGHPRWGEDGRFVIQQDVA